MTFNNVRCSRAVCVTMFSINFSEYEVTHSIYHYVFHFFNVGIDFSCRLEMFSNLRYVFNNPRTSACPSIKAVMMLHL